MMTLLEAAKKRDDRLRVIIKTSHAAYERLRDTKPDDPTFPAVLKATLVDLQWIEKAARNMFPNVLGAKL